MTPTQAQIEAVRERLQGYHDFLPDEAIAGALTAAAEVGETKDFYADAMLLGKEAENATIERCAQVAENFNAAGKPIAAAIRKQKDK